MGFTAELLGTGVGRGAEQVPVRVRRVSNWCRGEPEVKQDDASAGRHNDIGWLDVSVHDTPRVDGIDGGTQISNDLGGSRSSIGDRIVSPRGDDVGQRSSIEKLHRIVEPILVVDPVAIEFDNIRTPRAGDQLDFTKEPPLRRRRLAGGDDFEGDFAVGLDIDGSKHTPDPTEANGIANSKAWNVRRLALDRGRARRSNADGLRPKRCLEKLMNIAKLLELRSTPRRGKIVPWRRVVVSKDIRQIALAWIAAHKPLAAALVSLLKNLRRAENGPASLSRPSSHKPPRINLSANETPPL